MSLVERMSQSGCRSLSESGAELVPVLDIVNRHSVPRWHSSHPMFGQDSCKRYSSDDSPDHEITLREPAMAKGGYFEGSSHGAAAI